MGPAAGNQCGAVDDKEFSPQDFEFFKSQRLFILPIFYEAAWSWRMARFRKMKRRSYVPSASCAYIGFIKRVAAPRPIADLSRPGKGS